MNPNFNDDIRPIFYQYKNQMAWRFDLTNYSHVKDNAELIWLMISGDQPQMPPPPFSPLTADQLNTYQTWMANGCPES